MRIRDRATASVGRAVAFLASNWILLTMGAFFTMVLVVANLGLEFWGERTIRDGKVHEIKVDPARIFQQIGVLLLAVPALIFAVWRSWTAHQQAQASLEQARIAGENAKLAERGQNVDRYQKAVVMLNSERLSVRQAGIYALRELAIVDSAGHRLLAVQLLSGFARDRSSEVLRFAETLKNDEKSPTSPDDLIDAIRTIGELLLSQPNAARLHLSSVYLERSSFAKLNLSRGNFARARLANIFWRHIDLANCDFTSAALNGAVFSNCSLSGSLFPGADLSGARISRSDLSGVIFAKCKVVKDEKPNFIRCNVSGAAFAQIEGLSPGQFKHCWAWKDQPPTLPWADIGAAVSAYDPGVSSANRKLHSSTASFRRPDSTLCVTWT